ncbi:uncharacterized protein A1O9_11673 [Exophiala aquamarina CBS 119918]|uniref:Transcription factor domain-containing protein n=1 Tax=Exophiala aquamarina CBS 119918 TaxID=1182545 RepID=A0A072NYE4_9EURO|nr:uncharacterized protein A1O9_11673 [Exophiala aquamarina CBS 119918]KEF52432.1 hypothetical protein A1O9_11673 [Exophiala aquamarina CBS 119918]
MAVRIAQTLGLHRHSAVQPSTQHGVQKKAEQLFHARIWAICCCLEKFMQLESGRPTMIAAVDRDQMMGRDQRPPGPDFLQWLMGLAQYQERIIQHIYGYKPGERTARTVLLDTAELDSLLLAWANEVPAQYRLGAHLFCFVDEYHFAAYLSIQYHQAMIALHRAGLIAPTTIYEAEVATHCAGDPSEFRLRKGEYICIHSAREIATLTLELADRKANSRILNAGPPLMACIVIAIYLMKNPTNRLRVADLELLKECANYNADHFLDSGHDPRFAHGVVTIYEQVKAHFDNFENNNGRKNAKSSRALIEGTNELPTQKTQPESQQGASLAYHAPFSPNQNYQFFTNADGGIQMDNQGNASLDCGMKDGKSSNNFDLQNGNVIALFPFDGLNVEDLWNWMLVTDAIEPTDETEWMGTQVVQNGSEPLRES